MRRIIITAMIINLFLTVFSSCTRSRCNCDECCDGREYRELWDRNECRHWHRNVIMPREFFDPRDFHPDSISGDPHEWLDENYSRFHDDACRYHEGKGRHWKSSRRHYWHSLRRHDHDDALSKRYIPPPAPDMEYNE